MRTSVFPLTFPGRIMLWFSPDSINTNTYTINDTFVTCVYCHREVAFGWLISTQNCKIGRSYDTYNQHFFFISTQIDNIKLDYYAYKKALYLVKQFSDLCTLSDFLYQYFWSRYYHSKSSYILRNSMDEYHRLSDLHLIFVLSVWANESHTYTYIANHANT